MLGALKSDGVQIASTVAGLALTTYFVMDWKKRKAADPSIDPLRSGADPNFPGGKPITPHLHDPSPIVPSCEIYDPYSNLYMNLGQPNLDNDRDACLKNTDPNAVIRFVDSDQKVWTKTDSLFYPGDVAGTCVFPDAYGKLYSPPSFAAPNQASRLCFNSADTQSMSSFFFLNPDGTFVWNPNINAASAYLDQWSIRFAQGDIGQHDVDEIQTMASAILTGPDFVGHSGEAFARDPSLGANHVPVLTDIDGNRFRRLFLPSKGVIVYWNPNATDPARRFVSYPILAH